MISPRAPGWQLILADLALILFLVTLSTLANEASDDLSDAEILQAENSPKSDPQVAQSLALFRPTARGPSLEEWLAEQSADSRATLTIFAQHGRSDRPAVWEQAQTLAGGAADKGFAIRVVITRGEVSDVYASLAYDSQIGEPLGIAAVARPDL